MDINNKIDTDYSTAIEVLATESVDIGEDVKPLDESKMDTEKQILNDSSVAIQYLAAESIETIEEITPLYEKEWSRLGVNARIKSYLSILTMHNVRNLLHKRSDKT
jgi:hypothetical protein